MGARHQVVAVARAHGKLVEADGGVAQCGLRTVETGAHHPTAGAAPLYVALAEGGGEREPAVVEGVVEIEVERFLRHLSAVYVDSLASHLLMAMIGFRGEVNHVEAIAVAVGVEVQLIVLALAHELGGVDRQAQAQSAVSHRHAERAPEFGQQAGAVGCVLRLGARFHVGARQVAVELHRPPRVGTRDVGRVVFHLAVVGGQERVAPEEQLVVALQLHAALGIAGHKLLFLLLAHVALPHFLHDQRVAPLQHVALVGRLSQQEPQAVGAQQYLAQRLSGFLVLGHAA